MPPPGGADSCRFRLQLSGWGQSSQLFMAFSYMVGVNNSGLGALALWVGQSQ